MDHEKSIVLLSKIKNKMLDVVRFETRINTIAIKSQYEQDKNKRLEHRKNLISLVTKKEETKVDIFRLLNKLADEWESKADSIAEQELLESIRTPEEDLKVDKITGKEKKGKNQLKEMATKLFGSPEDTKETESSQDVDESIQDKGSDNEEPEVLYQQDLSELDEDSREAIEKMMDEMEKWKNN